MYHHVSPQHLGCFSDFPTISIDAFATANAGRGARQGRGRGSHGADGRRELTQLSSEDLGPGLGGLGDGAGRNGGMVSCCL